MPKGPKSFVFRKKGEDRRARGRPAMTTGAAPDRVERLQSFLGGEIAAMLPPDAKKEAAIIAALVPALRRSGAGQRQHHRCSSGEGYKPAVSSSALRLPSDVTRALRRRLRVRARFLPAWARRPLEFPLLSSGCTRRELWNTLPFAPRRCAPARRLLAKKGYSSLEGEAEASASSTSSSSAAFFDFFFFFAGLSLALALPIFTVLASSVPSSRFQ